MKQFALNDKNNLRILRAAIEENLAEYGREVGLTFKTGNISFEGDGTGCKVQLLVAAADAPPQHEKDFKKYWRLYAGEGLLETHLHAKFTTAKGEHELVGLMPSRSKFPFVVKVCATGKTILMTTSILPKLGAKPIPSGLTLVEPPTRGGE